MHLRQSPFKNTLVLNGISLWASELDPNFWLDGGSSAGRESACNAGDPGLTPGLGRSPGGGHGNPLPYSSLEVSMDRGAWQAIIHGVGRNWTFWTFFVTQDMTERLTLSLSIWHTHPLLKVPQQEPRAFGRHCNAALVQTSQGRVPRGEILLPSLPVT